MCYLTKRSIFVIIETIVTINPTTLLYSPEEIAPLVNTALFGGHETERFAVGLLATGTHTSFPEELKAYHLLRTNVYAVEKTYIDTEEIIQGKKLAVATGLIRSDEFRTSIGLDYNEDEYRSVHFGVLENKTSSARMVACMRGIIKVDEKPLPIEHYFSEIFEDQPAALNAAELSRYICRHPDKSVQNFLKFPLLTAAIKYGLRKDVGPAYAIVEEFLAKQLKDLGVPLKELAPPKFIEEYNSVNLPIVINPRELLGGFGFDPDESDENPDAISYFGFIPKQEA